MEPRKINCWKKVMDKKMMSKNTRTMKMTKVKKRKRTTEIKQKGNERLREKDDKRRKEKHHKVEEWPKMHAFS